MKTLFFKKRFTNSEFFSKIQQLNQECKFDLSSEEISKKQDTEFDLINEILSRSLNKQLESVKPFHLIKCVIKCLVRYSYHTKMKFQLSVSEKKSISKYNISLKNYKKLIIFYKSDYSEEILKTVVNLIHQQKLWKMRRLCFELFLGLYNCGYNESLICNEICNEIERKDEFLDDRDYKAMAKVLYQLLDVCNWAKTSETELFIERLMNLYFKSLHNPTDENYDPFFDKLRGSLELCVTHIISHISQDHVLIIIQQLSSWSVRSDLNPRVILNYGSVLVFAAQYHKNHLLINTFTPNVFPLIMQMISSDLQFVSLLGNRVFQSLIDRNFIKSFFNTPQIFFPHVKKNFKVKNPDAQDVKFLMDNREIIHKSLLKSIINHRSKRSNLETAYCTLCLLVLEIPCGFSATAMCCLMMNLQEFIRKYPCPLSKYFNPVLLYDLKKF